MKGCEQWEVKSLFSPFYGSLFSRPFDPTVHWVTMAPEKITLVTRPELHKSVFYREALLLISICWRLYLFPCLWRAFSVKSDLKGKPGCLYACEKRPMQKTMSSKAPLNPVHTFLYEFESPNDPPLPPPCVVTLKWNLCKNHPCFYDKSLIFYWAAIVFSCPVQMMRGVHFFSPLLSPFLSFLFLKNVT